MTKFKKFEYKIEGKDKIVKAFHIENQGKEDGYVYYELDETFSRFKIRLEFELDIKIGSGDWKKVLWRKEGEDESSWKSLFVNNKEGKGVFHEEHGRVIYY